MLVGVLSAYAPTRADVRFSAPRARATALGPTEVRLVVDAPAGTDVVRIDIAVDGEPLATLTEPPWQLMWDAGDGSRGHTLSAVVRYSDGSEDTATVRTTSSAKAQPELLSFAPGSHRWPVRAISSEVSPGSRPVTHVITPS